MIAFELVQLPRWKEHGNTLLFLQFAEVPQRNSASGAPDGRYPDSSIDTSGFEMHRDHTMARRRGWVSERDE